MQASRGLDGAADGAGLPVAQYVRMSTEHQRYSIENQSAAIQEYATANGMRIVRTYTDSGKSGLSLRGRYGLQQLLADVQVPPLEFVAVLVYDVSRWGRFQDPDEAGEYERMCRRNGVRVEYCAEQFKNDGSISATVMLSIKRSMAAEYSRELSVKVAAGQKTLVERGYHMTGPPGFGLRRLLVDEFGKPKAVLATGERKSLRNDRVVLTPGPPSEVEIVQSIYNMYLVRDLSERRIADELNRMGFVTDRGIPWSKKSVHNVLTNEKYIGNNVFNRKSFKLKLRKVKNPRTEWYRKDGAFPAIVPAAQYWKVQEKLEGRAARWKNDELLNALRGTLRENGTLTARVVGRSGGPAANTYRIRFGSLSNAYEQVGFSSNRNYVYYGKRRAAIRWRQELIEVITAGIQAGGGWVEENPTTGHLVVNGDFTVALATAMCNTHCNGQRTWNIPAKLRREADVAVIAKMNLTNDKFLDYLVIPSMADDKKVLMLRPGGESRLNVFGVETLGSLFELARRVTPAGRRFAQQVPKKEASSEGETQVARPPRFPADRPPRPDELAIVFGRDAAKYQLLQCRSSMIQEPLDQAQRIFGDLLASAEFLSVLKAANLETIPECLARKQGA